jgi:methyl-accepting chemotaxis protein
VTAFSFPVVSAVLAAVIVIGLGLVWWLSRRIDPRQRALTELLDAADALESRLRTARAEIESITGGEDDTVRTALQEMLRQRLWLQQHGATASLRTLKDMRSSLDEARHRIDQQLVLVQQARGPQPDPRH